MDRKLPSPRQASAIVIGRWEWGIALVVPEQGRFGSVFVSVSLALASTSRRISSSVFDDAQKSVEWLTALQTPKNDSE